MQITCPACGNTKRFLLPLWVRVTFKFNTDGSIAILHVRQLESLEDKLTDQGQTSFAITCKECGGAADVILNEYETLKEQQAQRAALEEL